jgi:NitT/TauT family transport system permease protein
MSGFTDRVIANRWALLALRVAFGALVIAAWQLLVSGGVIKDFVLATPAQVVTAIGHLFSDGGIWSDIGATLLVTVAGFVGGVILGTVLGVLSGTVPWLGYYFRPFFSFFNSVPRLVLIPILIVWLGFGFAMQSTVVLLVIVFLIAITVEAGVGEIQDDLVRNARVLGASWPQLMRTVFVPGVSIWIVSVARQSLGHAFTAAVVAEFFGAAVGLGALINTGQQQFDTPQIYAAIVITAVLALLGDQLLKLADRRVSQYLVR